MEHLESTRRLVNESFTKENNHLYLSYIDNMVIRLFSDLGIYDDIKASIEPNSDFFTFDIVNNERDLDLVFIIYKGKLEDSGFVVFYLKGVISNRLNIVPVIDLILKYQPSLSKNTIFEVISERVLLTTKMFTTGIRYVASLNESSLSFINEDLI